MDSSGNMMMEGDDYSADETRIDSTCLGDGSYTFTIYDSYGDGLCCTWGDGSYSVKVNDEVVASGAEYGDEDVTDFTIGDSNDQPTAFPTPTPIQPTLSPLTSTSQPTPFPVTSTSQPTQPTPYPSEKPPTPYPSEKPPTPYPSEKPPTLYPTQRTPTMFPTHTPPTMFPTNAMCLNFGALCTNRNQCCSKKCRGKRKKNVRSKDLNISY